MRFRRALAAGLVALSVALVGTACSEDPPSTAVIPHRTPTPSYLAPEPSADSPSPRHDLATLPQKRTLRAGSLTVDVEYKTIGRVSDWRTSISKPLFVSVSAVNAGRVKQKLYLMRATAGVTASNHSGPLEDTQEIIDVASLPPGFIITKPNTYDQSFTIPAVDESTALLTVDLTYEIWVEVSRDEFGIRDFAKRVATDRLVIPLDN